MMSRLGKINPKEWSRDKLDALRTSSLGQWLKDMAEGRFNPSVTGMMTATMACGPTCEFYGICRFDKGRAIEMGLSEGDSEEGDE